MIRRSTSAQTSRVQRVQTKWNPVGSRHFGALIIPSSAGRDHQILLTTCHNCVRKGLCFFADRAAKKWPLRGSLKLG